MNIEYLRILKLFKELLFNATKILFFSFLFIIVNERNHNKIEVNNTISL